MVSSSSVYLSHFLNICCRTQPSLKCSPQQKLAWIWFSFARTMQWWSFYHFDQFPLFDSAYVTVCFYFLIPLHLLVSLMGRVIGFAIFGISILTESISTSWRNWCFCQGVVHKSAKKKKGMVVGFVTFEDAEQLKSAIEVSPAFLQKELVSLFIFDCLFRE